MDVIDFDKIDRARKTLDLGDKASLKEIKSAYRAKVKAHHPDSIRARSTFKVLEVQRTSTISKGVEGSDYIKEINEAYKILIEYCENYSCSFKKKDVEDEDAYIRYMKSFENDCLWGKGRIDK